MWHPVVMKRDERRQAPRTRIDLLFNKYIDGYPHLCRTIDVSEGGMLLERVHEPRIEREFYPVELGLLERSPDGEGGTVVERLWLWARAVWTDGDRQALSFVDVTEQERVKLDRLLERAGYLEAAVAI